MKILYCDDDKEQLELFRNDFTAVLSPDEIGITSDPYELIESAENGEADIILLDIDLKRDDIDGIEICRRLREKAPQICIILVTAYSEKYIQNVFLAKANISGFLTKPVSSDYLIAMIDKTKAIMNENKKQISVNAGGKLIVLDTESIIYAESTGRLVEITTSSEKIKTYIKIREIKTLLPDSFMQCHKSFIVNMDLITEISSGSIKLINNYVIPISRSYRGYVSENYKRYRIEKLIGR